MGQIRSRSGKSVVPPSFALLCPQRHMHKRCGQPAGQIMLTKISLILLTVILTACQSKTNINGHWHSLNPETGTHKTLDISDTLTIANKFELTHMWYTECLRKNPDSISSSKLYLPLNEWSSTDKYYLKSDTLIIGDGQTSYKYKRSNLNECEIGDRYQALPISIKPPLITELSNDDELDFREDFGSIYIGTTFNEESKLWQSSSLSLFKETYPDSVFIQVFDIFIKLDGIEKFCFEIKEEFNKDIKPSIILHADNSVNQLFLDRVIENIPTTFDVYRTVTNNNNSLRLIKLR